MDRLDELAGPHEQWCHGYAHGDCCGASDCDCGRDERRVAIAAALAEEREKARAPFLALAEEIDGLSDEHWTAYKSASPADPRRANPYTEGASDAYEEAADRIRRAAEVAE